LAFICVIEIHLHFAENGSLKGKRKELQAIKAGLQRRFGASVSETAHHDLWQRSTLSAALVGPNAGTLGDAAAKLERWVHSQVPDGVRVDRAVVSFDDVLER
jgi:uncharacterized protein